MSQAAIQKEFARLVGDENVFTAASDLWAYSYDAAAWDQRPPRLAVRPTSTEALGKVVALCHQEGLPLTVRGSGTNLSGGTIPPPGAVVVVTTGLNQILEINQADGYAVVQPGVITARLAAAVADRGLFYPPDPGSQAVSTLGGNVAENSGGLRGLKYGVTRDYVLGLSFFDASGALVQTGSRTVKCATGYNLAGLMVGSEGTLGVFAEIILKLIPPPASARALTAVFDTTEAASEAVAAIIAARIRPATLEYLDNFTVRAVEAYSQVGLPVEAGAMLLVEVDGHPAQVAEEAELVQDICRKQGASRVVAAKDAAERNRIWEARRAAIPALSRLKPTTMLEDATVPRSRIPEMVRAIEKLAQRERIVVGIFGHAGDGNLHPTILCDRRDPEEWQRVRKVVEGIHATALELGGTLSGEHGIGLTKSRFLVHEVGQATIAWSRRLKAALDPKGILNPDKILGG